MKDGSGVTISRSWPLSLYVVSCQCNITPTIKTKFHYAILVADRSEAGRRPAASWNLAYH